MTQSPGFFDLDYRYAALSATDNPLERPSMVVDFEMFRPALDAALKRSNRAKGGHRPKDAVMMPKCLCCKVSMVNLDYSSGAAH